MLTPITDITDTDTTRRRVDHYGRPRKNCTAQPAKRLGHHRAVRLLQPGADGLEAVDSQNPEALGGVLDAHIVATLRKRRVQSCKREDMRPWIWVTLPGWSARISLDHRSATRLRANILGVRLS